MVEHLDDNNFEEKTKELCVVDFYADWCGPCKQMGPLFEELSKEMTTLNFFKVNTEKAPGISEKFEIRSIPCLIVMKDGKEISRIVGFQSKEELATKINHVVEEKV